MLSLFYVEKKKGFDIEAKGLLEDFKKNLAIDKLLEVRLLNKYIVNGQDVDSIESILYEPTVDTLNKEKIFLNDDEIAFAVEYLPGQYDQRADAASECFAILNKGRKIKIKSSKVLILKGSLTSDEVDKIKKYYINNVDSKEVDYLSSEFEENYLVPNSVEILNDFITLDLKSLGDFHKELGLAMSLEDIKMIQDYFKSEKRNPTITEIKVIDTYWSDHCRHTTFETSIDKVEIEESKYTESLKKSFEDYKVSRSFVYEDKNRDMTFMDMAVISMKEMRKRGILNDLDISEEINACSINIEIETDKGMEEYLLMFKNETHNHPTEIEPFGGAATCLGGAIRDPLSGRTYVYQAMRITGCGDPTVKVSDTIDGKLSQRKITLGAANGYSSYGNQIGLATGEVREIYHNGYIAKRMEVGAVLGAAPKENVLREVPVAGDVIILLGGKTGRDGCGGATGSSKEHSELSIELCGAEVQKGNAPTERKIQRLFRNKEITRLIKRCNDFGAGGVSVAIGELCDSLDINLDLVPKKYAGLDGTELAISESQERMAVVVKKEDAKRFIEISNAENLEATEVAKVTDTGYMRMFWNNENIVNLKREFLNTNGARQHTDIYVIAPSDNFDYFTPSSDLELRERITNSLKDLNISLQKGLVERFDSTIGTGTILMPFGGKYQLTPAEGMACKIPLMDGYTNDCSIMTSGLNPEIASWSPYHGAYYSIIEAVTKVVSIGGSYEKVRLTLQEYFEKLGTDKARWGKPFAALMGAYKVQKELLIPAIGGKDSMSGSFGNLDVPPTLVAFAVTTDKAEFIKSPEFKNENSKVIELKVKREEDSLLNMDEFKKMLIVVESLNKAGKILALNSIKSGGMLEALVKMSIGNKIGFDINGEITSDELFERNYGSMIIEVSKDFNLESIKELEYKVVATTNSEMKINILSEVFEIDELIGSLSEKLETVFKSETKKTETFAENIEFESVKKLKAKNKVLIPRVLIPVFPGTNCEYDSRKAFEKAGACVTELVFRNLTPEALAESLENLEKEIRKSQIVMLPGGFSAGDEPDGSAKFIATIFRNENIKEAVTDLLENRDGLMIGICNGFQALIKLGLVPYGKIVELDETMPTLTYNNIGRHMSSIVRTKICSNKSPWLYNTEVSDTYNVAISHGEGRFFASEDVISKLIENGQVATQYVDLDGKASLDMPFNPNGSVMAIESITSIDGRVLGKMGHSERIGENLYKNVIGDFDSKIFEAGVNYFK